MNPIKIAQDKNEEPPYEINGSVIPFVGKIFKVDDILIIVWKIRRWAKPEIELRMKMDGRKSESERTNIKDSKI